MSTLVGVWLATPALPAERGPGDGLLVEEIDAPSESDSESIYNMSSDHEEDNDTPSPAKQNTVPCTPDKGSRSIWEDGEGAGPDGMTQCNAHAAAPAITLITDQGVAMRSGDGLLAW